MISLASMQSLAAVGPAADWLTQGQELDWPLGDHSPLGRLYRRDGKVLLIGVGYNRNSSLHLGEIRAAHRRTMKRRIPVAVSAGVAWQEIDDVADDNGRLFPRVGEDFEATGQVMILQGCGARGTCIEYLRNTVHHLEALDLHDVALHRLLKLAESRLAEQP